MTKENHVIGKKWLMVPISRETTDSIENESLVKTPTTESLPPVGVPTNRNMNFFGKLKTTFLILPPVGVPANLNMNFFNRLKTTFLFLAFLALPPVGVSTNRNMKFKTTFLFLAFLALLSVCQAQNAKYQLLIGTYTNAANPEGIFIYDFNVQTGELNFKSKTAIPGANYLAVSPDRKYVYSVSDGGAIAAFNFNSQSGLTLINKQNSGGDASVYVSIDASGKYVFSANSSDGSVGAIPVQQDGSLGSNVQTIKHQGSSINKARQTKPVVHSVVVSPDNKFLFAQDLGTDKINIYNFDPLKPAPLTPTQQAFVSVTPGSGPRHLTIHPNKKFVYLIHEMGSLISGYTFENGVLTPIAPAQYIQKGPILPPDDGHAADIHVSPDGKFLYGSERGDNNEIVIYSIDQTTGKLTFAGRQSTLGIRPRNFVIDPTGNFVLAANQDSNTVFVFKRDQKTGLLTPTGGKIDIYRPACLKFVQVN